MLAGLSFALAGPAAEPSAQEPSGSHTFNYDNGDPRGFVVPDDVFYITVDARGGHGGSVGDQGRGGRPGQVRGVLQVAPQEILWVQVGRWGGAVGGPGCGNGGDHGATWGPSSGHSGAGGGGGTCVFKEDNSAPDDLKPMIVAGGGGGGGGNDSDGADGGAGGDGGLHPQQGFPGRDEEGQPNDEGRFGGCGGCRNSPNGSSGEGSDFGQAVGGGGGGGGGGWRGGAGGDNGVYRFEQVDPIGGSGGGGGLSWTDPEVLAVQHTVSSAPCQHHDPPEPTCNGQVTLSWGLPPASAVASAGNNSHAFIGQDFPTLAVTVRDVDGIPLNEVPVEFEAPASGPSGLFPGSASSATVATNEQGVATAPRLIANEIAGQWTLEAHVEGLDNPVRFTLTNDAAPTSTTVTSTVNPSVAGEEVSFTATVSAGPAFHSVPPTGQVLMTIDGAPIGAPIPLDPATGKATLPAAQVPPLTVDNHNVSATYLGDPGHSRSGGTLFQEVEKAATTVELISGPNPAPEGLEVAFQATVRPQSQSVNGPTPTGTIRFEDDDGNVFATVTLGPQGFALWETDELPVGQNLVLARYGGDDNYAGGIGRIFQTVGNDATATEVSSSANPAVHGEAIRWTATVRRQVGGDPPAGSIGFELDGDELCAPQPVDDAGSVSCAPSEPLTTGEHSVVASYEPELGSGDEPSQGTLAQRVVPARTSLDVSVDPEPSALGAPITLHGEVAASQPSTTSPAGEVQFALDGEPAGSPVELIGGAATLGTSCELPPVACNLAVGAHPVEAEFRPSGPDVTGARATAVHWVSPAPTTTAIESSANPQHLSEPVRFTATVSADSGSQRPFGTVQFFADGAPVSGPIGLVNGRAVSPRLETLTRGPHEITARFLGSPGYAPSAGSLTQRITRLAPPRLSIVTRRARVRPSGRFRLLTRCGGTEGQRCFATARVKSARQAHLPARRAPRGTRIAFRNISLPTTRRRKMRFTLSPLGARVFEGRRSLAVRVWLRPHMGTLAPRAHRVRLVAPKHGIHLGPRGRGGDG